MGKLLVIGIVLFIVAALIIWNLNKKKKGRIVLGREMAAAYEKEQQRIETGNYSKSPMPDYNYSKWPDEQSLIDPIENELDARITELCKEYESSNQEKRQDIRTSISQDEIYTLLTFVQRATVFGIRKNEPSYIYCGFTAVAMIEAERCDFRDVLVALSFLKFAIQKLNLNSKAIYDEVIPLSEGKTNNLLHQFAESTEQQNIETIGGYIAIETENGIGFIQTYYENYHPKKNLVKVLLNISDSLINDKYKRGEITVGEKIAPIWLNADNDKKIEAVISSATGCASLSTYLNGEFRPIEENQSLLIYVAEFEHAESLQVLTKQVNSTTPKNFARLSLTEDNIFCIIIQRAVRIGFQDFETNSTLQRFEPLIRKAIKQNL